jgi:hypothetical protein
MDCLIGLIPLAIAMVLMLGWWFVARPGGWLEKSNDINVLPSASVPPPPGGGKNDGVGDPDA